MINIVLDTNIWLYLANGFDAQNNKYPDGDSHIKLFGIIKREHDEDEIKVIVNDVILIEWERTKKNANARIDKLYNAIREIDKEFDKNSKYLSDEDKQIQLTINERLKERIKSDISKNIQHIINVEAFLKEDCCLIPISDNVKIQIWNMAINKDIPFQNSKNNFGDVTLLLSSIELMDERNHEKLIFVSNNKEDFCARGSNNDFHPEFKKYFKYDNIFFAANLSLALKTTDSIKESLLVIDEELEEFYKQEEFLQESLFTCDVCNFRGNVDAWGYLDKKMKVIPENIYYNTDQIELFDDLTYKTENVYYGYCRKCNSLHIECPNCSNLLHNISISKYDNESYNCEKCHISFTFEYQRNNEEYLLVTGSSTE